jgi:ketosteroid isomerase-like protein
MPDVNSPCPNHAHVDVDCRHLHDGVALFTCNECGHQDVVYEHPNTGNHPDHPPVPGGYRGGATQVIDLFEALKQSLLQAERERGQQVINPGLATEAVIDVPAEPCQ